MVNAEKSQVSPLFIGDMGDGISEKKYFVKFWAAQGMRRPG